MKIRSLLIFLPVPAPSVSITGIPSFPLYAGTSLSLTCTFELHSMIDSQVRLSGIWRRGGVTLGSNGRVNASAITIIRPSVYQTTLTISPLSNTLDDGQYTCQSTIPSDPFVLYADASQQVRVRIGGRHDHVAITNNIIFHYFSPSELPAPLISITSEGNSVAGENYTLICTVSVVEGLADGASIAASWTDDRRNPLQSDILQTSNTNTTLTLEFVPLFSSHGGRYMCNASIIVPMISTVKMSSEPYDIIIQSNTLIVFIEVESDIESLNSFTRFFPTPI